MKKAMLILAVIMLIAAFAGCAAKQTGTEEGRKFEEAVLEFENYDSIKIDSKSQDDVSGKTISFKDAVKAADIPNAKIVNAPADLLPSDSITLTKDNKELLIMTDGTYNTLFQITELESGEITTAEIKGREAFDKMLTWAVNAE